MPDEQGDTPLEQSTQLDQRELQESHRDLADIQMIGGHEQYERQTRAEMESIRQRIDDKNQLAQTLATGSHMRVDPDQVDALAKFFDGKADEMEERRWELHYLTQVPAPGLDPTSEGAAQVLSKVGQSDDGQSYLENYPKLIGAFREVAANLRGSAQQTRTDDQNNADAMGGQSA